MGEDVGQQWQSATGTDSEDEGQSDARRISSSQVEA
jgi:hypothetical protein